MLNNALGNAANFLRKNGGVVGKAKAASSMYLLYRYGFSPLVKDVAQGYEGLSKALGMIRQTSRGAAADSKTSVTTSAGGSWGTWTYTKQWSQYDSLSVRAMSLDEYEASMGFNVGFSTKDLLTLPWELIPYSFVVDWFLNIGDVIGAITPTFGVQQLGSCLVTEWESLVDFTSYGYHVTSPSLVTSLSTPGGFSCQMKSLNKARTVGLPAPGLTIKSDFRLTSLTRCADAVALVVQRLK
jgi:hypothetical protein